MNEPIEPREFKARAPCEHVFQRVLKTTKGDVNTCKKCMWVFYQSHTPPNQTVVSMGAYIEMTALQKQI